jgi:hypothetical protein
MHHCRTLRAVLLSGLALVGFPSLLHAQTLTIEGVADRANYRDSASFRVVSNAGFTYQVTLNGLPVPAGITNTVLIMDYYELAVKRTQTSDSSMTNALVRFIVDSSRRSGSSAPEFGLLEWFPLKPIPSTAAEMAGAHLKLMTPKTYPAGLPIPIVARVEDDAGNTRRVNGWVSVMGFESNKFRLLRGVGHGFLPPATPGTINCQAQIQALQASRQIVIETNTVWENVGAFGSRGENSRLRITYNVTTANIEIGAGTVVLVDPGMNITNEGRLVINGTEDNPVIFTSAALVAPEQRAGAWGGFIMRYGELIANHTIMTGSGAAASLSYSPGSSHRSEQPLLFAHNSVVRMTNCALINLAGQVGNGYHSIINWDHCLIQRAITCGEYDGGTNIISHSAVIEFPAVDGVYSATISDADYDGFYTINTTNYFEHSLFGFAKDDAIDSGSGGGGTVVVTNCWIESALHEALAWSGESRRTRAYDSVLINCGQGLEAGWSTTNTTSLVSPICLGERLLSTGNSIGTRYGDNYTGTSGLGNKAGFLTVSNSILIYNYRDVFGRAWDNTWNYRSNWMDIRSNYLTAPNPYHPSNAVWNAATDAMKLAAFMTTPAAAPVGIGLAAWPEQFGPGLLTNGLPVRLSSFTTHPVSVDYAVATPSAVLASGTLTFAPGETVKKITLAPATVQGVALAQVSLSNPVGGEITGDASAYVANPPAAVTPPSTTLIPYGSIWKYLDDGSNQGTAWRNPGFNDAAWASGPAQLGFGDGGEATVIRRTNSVTFQTNITFYFRRSLAVANQAQFGDFQLSLLRDDAGVVYFNGTEVFRSPNLPTGTISFNTLATSTGEDTVDTTNIVNSGALLSNGFNNMVACEIHQQALSSSDVSFDLQLTGLPAVLQTLYSGRFGNDLVFYWSDPTFVLESTVTLPGGWQAVAGAASPFAIVPGGPQRFYRLRK